MRAWLAVSPALCDQLITADSARPAAGQLVDPACACVFHGKELGTARWREPTKVAAAWRVLTQIGKCMGEAVCAPAAQPVALSIW